VPIVPDPAGAPNGSYGAALRSVSAFTQNGTTKTSVSVPTTMTKLVSNAQSCAPKAAAMDPATTPDVTIKALNDAVSSRGRLRRRRARASQLHTAAAAITIAAITEAASSRIVVCHAPKDAQSVAARSGRYAWALVSARRNADEAGAVSGLVCAMPSGISLQGQVGSTPTSPGTLHAERQFWRGASSVHLDGKRGPDAWDAFEFVFAARLEIEA
jgi:hypothetical protein